MDKAATEAFWAVLQRLGGAAIVTSAFEDQIAGCYVGFLGGCSVKPPRLLVCMSNSGGLTAEIIDKSQALCVHLIGQGQEEWFKRFALQSGRTVDKFNGLEWRPGATSSPILVEAIGYIEGKVIASLDCGDHTAKLLEPLNAELREPAVRPLTGLELLALDPSHSGPTPVVFETAENE